MALAARSNEGALLKLVVEFGASRASLMDPSADSASRFAGAGAELSSGLGGLSDMASMTGVDHVVFASSGADAIAALQRALISDKDVSLANKESIVAAGPWVMPLVRRPDQLRPIDSEHSAIWQCLRDEPERSVSKILLTASGGPFREWSLEQMRTVTPDAALKHPVWAMGAKITIDSATLMNKGIECIEAMQLFGTPPDKVGAIIHPGSRVHGLVMFSDATIKLLLSRPDMRLPAAAALAWPGRLDLNDIEELSPSPIEEWNLEFHEPDTDRFPCLKIALEAGRMGGAYPPLLIGADESAVNAFLNGRIPFLAISHIIERTLEGYSGQSPRTLEDAIDLISIGAKMSQKICENRGG
jgi:1-deoxy-D-xylulose-5-phosphate reductoisomerase